MTTTDIFGTPTARVLADHADATVRRYGLLAVKAAADGFEAEAERCYEVAVRRLNEFDPATRAPQVGDRVELTDLEDGVRCSFLGTVRSVRPNGLWVRMDNGEVWSTVGGGPVLRSILR